MGHFGDKSVFSVFYLAILLLVAWLGVTSSDLKPFGALRRRLTFIAILIGLSTFIAPAISISPPVLGRAHWSPLDISSCLSSGALPLHSMNGSVWANAVVIYFITIYALLLAGIIALIFFPSPKILGGIAFLGGVTVMRAYFSYDDIALSLKSTFYSIRADLPPNIGIVDISRHSAILIGVMLAIIAIACCRSLESPTQS